MKKANLLSKTEMKKVMGGTGYEETIGDASGCSSAGGLCSTWTEEVCCSGLTCKGQKDNVPGLCG